MTGCAESQARSVSVSGTRVEAFVQKRKYALADAMTRSTATTERRMPRRQRRMRTRPID
jgi:hypothetical protein